MPGPHFLVRNEFQLRDKWLELYRRLEDHNGYKFDPEREELVAKFRWRDEYPGRVFVDLWSYLKRPCNCRGKHFPVNYLLPHIDKNCVTGFYPADSVDVPPRYSPDVSLNDNLRVLPAGDCKLACHKAEYALGDYDICLFAGIQGWLKLFAHFLQINSD